MERSDGPHEEARERARLIHELNENALRELALAVRVAELERNRWAGFSMVELEWITSALVPPDLNGFWPPETLPGEANAALDRRSRSSVELDEDLLA
jgi:hypothetical protein